MRYPYLPLGALLALLTYPQVVGAQSLADVARAEETRRKNIKGSTKVYTNGDLTRDGSRTEAPPVQGTPSPQVAPPKPETENEPPKADAPQKDETYWKDRMNALRSTLSRSKIMADALESRVNALNTDFVNRDDPVQRAAIEQDRKAALAEMDRVKLDVEKTNKAIVDLEEEARKANVPPGWLR